MPMPRIIIDDSMIIANVKDKIVRGPNIKLCLRLAFRKEVKMKLF